LSGKSLHQKKKGIIIFSFLMKWFRSPAGAGIFSLHRYVETDCCPANLTFYG